MDTYGMHAIHGRAPTIATGLAAARDDLSVWIVSGDGDALSIGGNHLIHTIRRNVGLKILLFNNRIYGLTKGQYSPTSEMGKRTKSTPHGSVDYPFNPLSVAIGAGATFVARSVDVFQQHLKATLKRAAEHKGTAFVEIYQNCNIFNDGAFTDMAEKETREETTLYLEHGKPLVYGAKKDKGIRLDPRTLALEIVPVVDGVLPADLVVWDETRPDSAIAYMLAQLQPPAFPTPVGVFRAVSRPTYEERVIGQIQSAQDKKGVGTLEELLYSGEVWKVRQDGSIERQGMGSGE
jgi:2-oxoglutarate ferredoxin oxidoreductase subunit beta